MTDEEKAQAIAEGIVCTGIEGPYCAVSCSTAGDYPSIGVSQWEGINGGRGDHLLGYIDGGDYYAGRSFSDIESAGELEALSELLDSDQGQAAQNMILASDCLDEYLPALMDTILIDDRCIIYCGMWCPTSHSVVSKFLQRRSERGYDINNLETLRDLFRDEYAIAAGYADDPRIIKTYYNRANTTYEWVVDNV